MQWRFRFSWELLGFVVAATVLAASIRLSYVQPSQRPVSPSMSAAGAQAALATTTATAPTSTVNLAPNAPASVAAKKPVYKTLEGTSSPVTVQPASPSTSNQATSAESLSSTPPESAEIVNATTRAALVNILCNARDGSFNSVSGSGVIIDPRGVVLTNAHVAQYVLLSESPQINLSCFVRAESPAKATWTAHVLYIPSTWVDAHASGINQPRTAETGEHDYALLYITGALDSAPLPNTFPNLPYDAREAISLPGDEVLVASYPAEFLGSLVAENSLFAASSVASIQNVFTFGTNTVDILSLGGVIEAQSGSSGGAVVNPWGKLVGIITTTSEGTTTASRDLHALTLSYIDRDMKVQSGLGLPELLNGDLAQETLDFTRNDAPGLIKQYLQVLSP